MKQSQRIDVITVYGIKNCDQCRRALKWLVEMGVQHSFHDFRVDGLSKALLQEFCEHVSWENILNKRGTTWRRLSDSQKDGISAANAQELMLSNPTLIKRPVFKITNTILIGFSGDELEKLKSIVL